MVKEKKDTKELLNELEQEMVRVEKEKVDLRNDKERIAYLEHLCENIKEAKKQCEDIKLCGGGCFARWYGSGVKEAYPSECALKRVSIAQIKKA